MAKKPRAIEPDTLRKLKTAFDAGRGRIPIQDATSVLNMSVEKLRDSCASFDCAIGKEGDSEFLLSTATKDRESVIADFLERHAGQRFPESEVRQLVGVPTKSSLIYRIIPKNHTNIRKRDGHFWWHGDDGHKRYVSVADAASSLLYSEKGFQKFLAGTNNRVTAKLRRIWSRTDLIVAIDGGKTNVQVARKLASQELPIAGTNMVTYVTNQTAVEQVIFKSRKGNLHDPVLVGGRLRDNSKTYVGRFAEACWNAYSISPDVAFVAASTVSDLGEFSTSDFEESRFKSLMLGSARTTLRCIMADSQKILTQSGGGWKFASLDSIDVVVTDHGVLNGGTNFLNLAKSYGVLVVTDQGPSDYEV